MFVLSNDLKVACKIYEFHLKGERVWFSKLVESLAGILTKNEVAHCICTLEDWMIIYGEYGKTAEGRAGRLILIDEDVGLPIIKDCYEKHWEKK